MAVKENIGKYRTGKRVPYLQKKKKKKTAKEKKMPKGEQIR